MLVSILPSLPCAFTSCLITSASSWSSPSNLSPDLKCLFWLPWVCVLSHVWLFVTPWMVAHQVPLSMEFSLQEHWSGLPFPMPGDLPELGIKPMSLVPPAFGGRFFTTVPPRKHSGHLATLNLEGREGPTAQEWSKDYWGRHGGGGSLRLLFLLIRCQYLSLITGRKQNQNKV